MSHPIPARPGLPAAGRADRCAHRGTAAGRSDRRVWGDACGCPAFFNKLFPLPGPLPLLFWEWDSEGAPGLEEFARALCCGIWTEYVGDAMEHREFARACLRVTEARDAAILRARAAIPTSTRGARPTAVVGDHLVGVNQQPSRCPCGASEHEATTEPTCDHRPTPRSAIVHAGRGRRVAISGAGIARVAS